jgi:hypothetical protein
MNKPVPYLGNSNNNTSIPSNSSSSSSSSSMDPCSPNSPYKKIFANEDSQGIKPSKYCRIDRDSKKQYFCKQEGNAFQHSCTLTKTPYIEQKPSFFSMFSRKGGRHSHTRKNKRKIKSKKNKVKKRKSKKTYKK